MWRRRLPRWCRHRGAAFPSPSNQSRLIWREAATSYQSYQSPWMTSSQEGGQQASVSPEAAAAAAESKKSLPRWAPRGGAAQVRTHYEVHLPSLSFRCGYNLQSILEGAVLPTLHIHVLCKNWHLCGVWWGGCECKNRTSPPPSRGGNHHHRDN